MTQEPRTYEIRVKLPDGRLKLLAIVVAANPEAAIAQYKYECEPTETRALIAVEREKRKV